MRWIVALAWLGGCGRLGFDPTDVPPGGDAPSACNAMFCDGFEDPGLSRWGLASENSGTAMRDPSFGFVGGSLIANGPVASTLAARFVDLFVQQPTDEWVRVYLHAASGMVLDVEPVAFSDTALQPTQIVFSLYDDSADIHAHGIAGDFTVTDTTAPPRDRWVCYELHVAIGAQGVVELYRDGTRILASPAVDTRTPALRRLFVGIVSKPGSMPGEIHVDEVAAGTARVGC